MHFLCAELRDIKTARGRGNERASSTRARASSRGSAITFRIRTCHDGPVTRRSDRQTSHLKSAEPHPQWQDPQHLAICPFPKGCLSTAGRQSHCCDRLLANLPIPNSACHDQPDRRWPSARSQKAACPVPVGSPAAATGSLPIHPSPIGDFSICRSVVRPRACSLGPTARPLITTVALQPLHTPQAYPPHTPQKSFIPSSLT